MMLRDMEINKRKWDLFRDAILEAGMYIYFCKYSNFVVF